MSKELDPQALFKNEEGFTTLAFALVILVVLSLIFASAHFAHNQTQASEIQAVADSAALAGANVISRYMTAATVLDACVLSLGLLGMTSLAFGLVLAAVPALAKFSVPVIKAAKSILETRDKFGKSVYEGLSKLEKGLPYLVAANSIAVIRANSSDTVSYVGLALPFPKDGTDSAFEVLESLDEEAKDLEDSSDEVKNLAQEAEEFKEKAQAELEKAWFADCGNKPYSMYERSLNKAHLSASLNPYYPNYKLWDISKGLSRAQNYYQARINIEASEGASLEEQVKSVSRLEFYKLAKELCESSYIHRDADGFIELDLKELPKNTQSMRLTHCYSDVKWPVSLEGDYKVIHFSHACPGMRGVFLGSAALSSVEAGSVYTCADCNFSIQSLGKVPQASTAINNGFEYHYKAYREAAYAYAELHNQYVQKEIDARKASEKGQNALKSALDKLKAKRPKLTPPGRYGVVSVVVDGKEKAAQEKLVNTFSKGAKLPERAAIAGAVLAPEESDEGKNILTEFFEGLKAKAPDDIGIFFVDVLFDMWGGLLQAYSDGFNGETSLQKQFDEQLSSMGTFNSISHWISGAIKEILTDFGLAPPDLRSKKPVLTNTVNIFEASGQDGAVQVRHFIESLPPESYMDKPDYLAEYFLESAQDVFNDSSFTIGELLLPGSEESIPIEIDLE